MALSTPQLQDRSRIPPYWGVYAAANLLPNAAGAALPARQFALEAGDQAYVTGTGFFTCTNRGTAGGADATWASAAGDVVGPAAATDNALVRFDGVTGKLIQNGIAVESDLGAVASSDGTNALPTYTFNAELTTGAYRIGAGVLGITAGGLDVARFSAPGGANPQLLNAAGTAPLPSYSLTGDPNTGLYSVGADQLGTATNGVLRITVSTTAVTNTLVLLGPDGAVGTPTYGFSSDPNTGYRWISSGISSFGGDGLEIGRFSAPGGATPQILLAGGAVGTPAYSFTADTDTGIYNPGANTLTIVTGGGNQWSWAGATLSTPVGGTVAVGNLNDQITLQTSTTSTAGVGVGLRATNNQNYSANAGIQYLLQLNYGAAQTVTAAFEAISINGTAAASGGGAGTPAFGTGGGWALMVKQGGTAPTTFFSVTMSGAVGVLSTSQTLAAGNTDDYAGLGAFGVGRITSNGAGSVLRGILAPVDSRQLLICHVAGLTLTINNQDAGSAAANRIITGSGAALVLAVDDSVMLWYDLTSARWRVVAAQS